MANKNAAKTATECSTPAGKDGLCYHRHKSIAGGVQIVEVADVYADSFDEKSRI
jgi:hypothetical protein